MEIQTVRVGATCIQFWVDLITAQLKAVANMVRAYKLALQFLWDFSMESSFEEGNELHSQRQEAHGDASKHRADFAPWLISLQVDASFPPLLSPCNTNQRRAVLDWCLAEEDSELRDPTAVAPRHERDPLGLVIDIYSCLCVEDHQDPDPSGRSLCLEVPSWGKGSGKGCGCRQKGLM